MVEAKFTKKGKFLPQKDSRRMMIYGRNNTKKLANDLLT